MNFTDGSSAEYAEADSQPGQPLVVNCLSERLPSFLAAADSFKGVEAEAVPIDTQEQARLAADMFCASQNLQNGFEGSPVRGTGPVADSMFENRDKFSVVAIWGLEADGFGAFIARVEALEAQKHPVPELTDEEHAAIRERLTADFTARLTEVYARHFGGQL